MFVLTLSSECCLSGVHLSSTGQMKQSEVFPERAITLPVAKVQ